MFVNGVSVGTHTGGYCPFSFDITDELVNGENELVVKVYDPTDKGWQNRGKQVLKSVGFWYTGTSGIWQTVWLEPVAQSHITCVRLTPDIDAGEIIVSCTGEGLDGCTIEAEISLGGEQVYSDEMKLNAHLPVPDAKLWSPESPTLYDLVLTVKKNGEAVDTVKSYFGMRKFSIGKDKQGLPRLMLNNEPYFQRGLLDQGYWSDGGLTPPNDEAMIFDIAEMKRLGFNMLRKHIKVEPLRWYYHCDRLGMIVWQDMVSGGEYIGGKPRLLTAQDRPHEALVDGKGIYHAVKEKQRAAQSVLTDGTPYDKRIVVPEQLLHHADVSFQIGGKCDRFHSFTPS